MTPITYRLCTQNGEIYLIPKKNPYLERALVQLWLAKRHGEVVGRISTQIDPLAMEVRGYKEGSLWFNSGGK